MNRRGLSMAALAIAALLFIAVNVLSQATLRQARVDLTADHLFTLSDGTRHILAELKEPISLKLFFSDKLSAASPALRTYGQRVRELLEEYATRSHGMIRLQIIDPEPFSDAEDRAVQAGLQGIPLDEASGQMAYFGLVGTNTTDHQEVIGFFNQEREPFLEYDLTKLVYALTDPKKPVVGVLSAMDLTFGPGGMSAAMRGEIQSYAFMTVLRQTFDVRVLKPDVSAIDKDVTVLLIVRPQKLSDQTLYAIDQYVLAGGKAVMYVDPYAESAADQPGPTGMPLPQGPQSATLTRLFQAWGLEMGDKTFVADSTLAVNVSANQHGRRRALPYPVWLMVPAKLMNHGDVVTADLSSLMFASAGALTKQKDASLTLTPLVTTSSHAQRMDVSVLEGEPDPEALTATLATKTNGQTEVLAARVTGMLKSAFPAGPPNAKPDETPTVKPLAASTQAANLIVVTDSDMLEDRFWIQDHSFLGQRMATPFASNADFLVNAIDNLTGSSDLISLRGRAGASRPFDVVEDLRRIAAEHFLTREQELQKRLEQTQHQISELEGAGKPGNGGALLSKDEQTAIERFRTEVLQTRKALRDVQHNLNHDIEQLAASVKAINIGLMPVLVACFALGLAGWRVRRQNRPVRD